MTVAEATSVARWWAGNGWLIVPVAISWDDQRNATRKVPRAEGRGLRDATNVIERIEAMFAAAEHRLADGEVLGVGGVPGPAGYVVGDFDTKNGAAGKATLKYLLDEWPDLAICRYRSCSGALNAIMRKPEGCGPIGNAVPHDWHGVDIRADNGFVVLPGTFTPWGAWQRDQGSVKPRDAWVMTPAFLTLLGTGREGCRPATNPEMADYIEARASYTDATRALVVEAVDRLADAGVGERHRTLLSVLGQIIGLRHVDLVDALEQIQLRWNRLTAGEGREREVVDAAAWVIGQERDDDTHSDSAEEARDSSRGQVRSTPNLKELLDSEDPKYDWRIPDLFEQGDRLILTGKEGFGKSTLLRQIGLGAALGYNTLSADPFGCTHLPLTVLLVDLENSRRQLRREFTKALRAVDPDRQADLKERFYVESHPEGLVLDLARDPDGDRAWLIEVVESTRPDLLIIGPVYKMIAGEAIDETPNREMVKWLDRLRGAYDLVICLEAHTPHDSKRPYGWSGWKRWPEFGIHLDEDGQLEHWRAQRDERPWPERLAKGEGTDWLWTPAGARPYEPSADKYEQAIEECQPKVLRALRDSRRPLSKDEIVELVGRRRSIVLAAVARMRERGAFTVTTEERMRSNGRPMPVELFAIDPDGPFGGIE